MDASTAATPQTKKSTPIESGAHSASALTIGAKLKEFVVTGIIGEGGFGIVYSAKDTQLQRNVAIKEYMPAAIANRLASSKINLRSVRHQQTFAAGMQGFIDEARLLAQFKHPALVEILRFWEANGTAYMVMPHYSGKTLRNILKTSRNVCSERWLKSILGPVLDAIELLHSNNVYHRDIAPDNIVIQDTGQPVLLDLGSARRVIAGMQSALTVVVKPGYAPIEQYTEDTANEQGPWTDIYALGAVLYFAISGAAPTASVSRMMRDSLKLLNTDDYPHYSDSFLSSINKALQLRPCDRFQSIADFRDALNVHISLTGNGAFITPTQDSPVEHQETYGSAQHQDEEITLILSEDEISVFKEKLMQSLKSPAAAVSIHKNFNENILSNDPPIKKE
ncbi:serine/threonine protein kinase, partial [Cellvibrio sp.]